MKFSTILLVFGQVIGVTSTVFMAYVFFNEAFLGRGVLYVEPNIAIATLEFWLVTIGLFVESIVMLLTVSSKSEPPRHVHDEKPKAGEERTGYETNNEKVYQ
jgi:hypothetical protein